MKVLEMPSEYSINSDADLVALYLFWSKEKEQRAVQLLNAAGGLRQLIEMEEGGLIALGCSPVEAQRIRAIREIGARFVAAEISRGKGISSAEEAAEYLQLKLRHLEHEVFGILWLDQRHRIISWEEMFQGTLNEAAVYPREVVKSALAHNAAACIMAHNHPSGVAEPSRADVEITERLQEALGLLEIRLLDHIIVGDDWCSMAERGWR